MQYNINSDEGQYLTLLDFILVNGDRKQNRTGIDTFSVSGAHMQFDLRKGFPAMTTKKLAWGAVVAELLCFLRGATSAKDFRDAGTKIWDANANENQAWLNNPHRQGEDDLGRIYGFQWRNWQGANRTIDQFDNVIQTIKKDPDNRRIIISAWNPDDLDKMALPPCHVLYQFIANKESRTLDLCMYQRSADMFLGVPFNIASASLLLAIVAARTGYAPRFFNHFLADAHIYENHIEQVKQQLENEVFDPPTLIMPEYMFKEDADWLSVAHKDHFHLFNYRHNGIIRAEMAV